MSIELRDMSGCQPSWELTRHLIGAGLCDIANLRDIHVGASARGLRYIFSTGTCRHAYARGSLNVLAGDLVTATVRVCVVLDRSDE